MMLSGGACGWAPLGSPTAWNIESWFGRSTIQATTTSTGPIEGRLIVTLLPPWHEGIAKANKYRRFSASNPAERGGNS